MSKLNKEKDIINNEYLEGEDEINHFLQYQNTNNENNQNYEINQNIDINDYDNNNNMNNNIDLDSTQKAFVQTLNLQIKQLQELLEGKNKEFDNLNSENNKLKLLLIEEQKKIIDKENNLHSINLQKNNLEEKLNKYKVESDKMQSTIKELNYKLIELNQNIISKENIYNFNNKINNALNKDDINEENKNTIRNEKYDIELKRLSNLIDELEIKNNRLMFDNKILNNKISTIINDKNSEISIYKSIYQNQINNLNKIIDNLSNKMAQLFSERKIQKNFGNNGNNLIKKEILEKFNELENKLNVYDKENCNLRKINQNIKSELEELKLVGDSKEKIIQKLQTDFELMENEYNNNIYKTQTIDDNLKINDINKSQYINELLNNQKALGKENKDLKFGLKQMTKKINDANKLYYKKKAEYDKTLEIRDNKLKEYKTKISLLKRKINELHQEINILKENKEDFMNNINHYSFLTQNNNEVKNIKKEKQKLRNFTPKSRGNRVNNFPFEINIGNRMTQNNEFNDYNDIFGDLKISEVPKENIFIKPGNLKPISKEKNNKEKNWPKNEKMDLAELNNNKQNLKYIQEYKDTLNKIDEQIK